MRCSSLGFVVMLTFACVAEERERPAPIGARFWLSGGGFGAHVFEMFRGDDRIELREEGQPRAFGSLTEAGLSAWDSAVASVDLAALSNLPTCALVDGIDICVDVEHPSGDALEFCYCAVEPVPAIAEFDLFFTGLAEALIDCASTEHILVDDCP